MARKTKFNQKNEIKSDIKFDTNDLINVVVGLYPDAHAVVIFGDNGIVSNLSKI